MFVPLTQVCIVYVVKEVASFRWIGQLMGVADKRRRRVYMPSMEVQECSDLEVQQGHTHRRTDTKPFTVTLPNGKSQLYCKYFSR